MVVPLSILEISNSTFIYKLCKHWFFYISLFLEGLPDLSNITGALEQKQACAKKCQFIKESLFPSPPIEFSSNVFYIYLLNNLPLMLSEYLQARRLILSEIVTPPSGHVVDILEESEKDANKKKVSFSDPNDPATEEKCSQITSECICDG